MEKTYWYKEYSQGRRFFLKILPGQSLKANIRNLVIQEKIKVAVILSAIGSIRNVRINGIKSGAKLPTERALAEQLGVSRTALREAIQKLASRGVLESRVGAGTFVGSRVPLWHDSEVAAIAYAIQNILARRARQQHSAIEQDSGNATAAQGNQMPVLAGKKCPECGAHAMIRKDGCDLCTQCGHMGSCG